MINQGAVLGQYSNGPQKTYVGEAASPAAPTLLRALSSIDELNKRLYQLLNQTTEVAQAVGGPYPVDGANAKMETPPSSAMQRLNDAVNESHRIVSDIESAANAIRRSLGG